MEKTMRSFFTIFQLWKDFQKVCIFVTKRHIFCGILIIEGRMTNGHSTE